MTLLSIVTGVAVGACMNMGICYAGLQIGFTIVGSSVAAILGFGILRGLLRRGTILEVNIFQTVGSCVNTVNAGIIFTVPVMFLMGRQTEINYPALILATVGGALLGVAVIIPFRKQIIDYERLRFPDGTAVAAILKSPGAGVHKAVLLLTGIAVGALAAALTRIHVGAGTEPLLPAAYNVGQWLGIPAAFRLVFATSLLSFGAGYIAGRPGLAILYGTILNYWILIPVCLLLGWLPESHRGVTLRSLGYAEADWFARAFADFTSRLVGIGMILGGAVAGVLVAVPALRSALAGLRTSAQGGRLEEMPMGVLKGVLVLGVVLLALGAKLAGGAAVGWPTAVLLALVAGLWLWIAGLVVAQCTGRTNWSPLSGLALLGIAMMLGIMGTSDRFVVPAVTLGAATCVATSMCADMIADLKTGYLVGARPVRQQVAQMCTCWIGPGIALATVILLWKAYAFGPDQAKVLHERRMTAGPAEQDGGGVAPGSLGLPAGVPNLPAPQAGALEAAIRIVQSGDVPLGKYLTGASIGLLISLLVSPGLGVMVGLSMYLPSQYMFAFGLGGCIQILVSRLRGARFAEDQGVPIAAGFIVGDALVGVAHAMYKVGSAL